MKGSNDLITTVIGLLVVIVIIAVVFTAIYAPTEGYVTRKVYTEASYSNVGTPSYKPERYTLYIRSEQEGKWSTGVIAVDQVTFHKVQIGDYFNSYCMCVEKR